MTLREHIVRIKLGEDPRRSLPLRSLFQSLFRKAPAILGDPGVPVPPAESPPHPVDFGCRKAADIHSQLHHLVLKENHPRDRSSAPLSKGWS